MQRILNIGIPAAALLLFAVAGWLGLVATPAERVMGDVYRILYVHVPCAWMALLCFTGCFVASLVYLFKGTWKADAMAESFAEVGTLFGALLLVTGSIWARPTWGTWWTWDPRLTTAAIMWVAFSGYLALRRFVDVPERRATWAAVTAIIIFVDIPIVWFSVKWWNSLHQVQSSPKTVDPQMVVALRVSSFAFLAAMIYFVRERFRIGLARQAAELSEPPGALP